jgi:hypothetical protein
MPQIKMDIPSVNVNVVFWKETSNLDTNANIGISFIDFEQIEPFEIKIKLMSFLHFKIKLHNINYNLNMKQKKSNYEIKYM